MDQIADLLTRIRNSVASRNLPITVTHSKMKESILEIFKSEGFVDSCEIDRKEKIQTITFSISANKAPIHIKQISKFGRRVYASSKDIPRPLNGLGVIVISTSSGVTTGKIARRSGMGGELICEIW